MNMLTRPLLIAASTAALAACAVGPDYVRPPAPAPVAFKEAPAGWQAAQPGDGVPRGAWWSVYGDRDLDDLVAQVAVNNQNLKASEAAYRQATAVVAEARAGYSPTVSLTPSASRQRSGGSSGSAGTATTRSTRGVELSGSWEPDLWGKVRRQVESDKAAAQASAAELADLTLSAQAELVSDYMELRYQDSLAQLLDETTKAYERSLAITQNQYAAGTVSRADVITAQTQLATARASAIATGQLRAQYEHAIALLVGKPPSEVSIAVKPLEIALPSVPGMLPSSLLQRRPDIAEAERTMQQQNALIGVAQAAWYPTLSLTGEAGYSGLGKLFSAGNAIWSLAASASETLVDGGARSAQVAEARAGYDQSVANYRQTVLAAFQDVEDELSTLRVLGDQAVAQDDALRLARQAEGVARNEYQAGTVDYTTVVTAQATALSNAQASLQVKRDRLLASASLIRAVGGGWSDADLPMTAEATR
ncbi:efflux transporter outer membrane subunit [Bacillus sp. NP157]|nr:efflux transporter outer membrane subunit [Bacillus sp. NP157]